MLKTTEPVNKPVPSKNYDNKPTFIRNNNRRPASEGTTATVRSINLALVLVVVSHLTAEYNWII